MSDYKYHIFISYRRMDEDWVRWTRDNLVKPLRSLLRPGLGDVRIFLDEQIETGSDWPSRLACALARSRLLIPILSRDYFNSEWCQLELALLLKREQQCGLRSGDQPRGLILPLIIDDGNTFPSEIQAIQSKRIHDYANPWMVPNSISQEKFAEQLRLWCPHVEQALEIVPPYDESWEKQSLIPFQHTFETQVSNQTTVPSLSLATIPSIDPDS